MRGNILPEPDIDVRVPAQPFRKAAHADHRSQGYDERLNLQYGDRDAIHCTDEHTGRKTRGNGIEHVNRVAILQPGTGQAHGYQ